MKRRNFLRKSAEFLGLGALVATGVVKANPTDAALVGGNPHEFAWWKNKFATFDRTDIEIQMQAKWAEFTVRTGNPPGYVRLGQKAMEAYVDSQQDKAQFYTREDVIGFPTVKFNGAPVHMWDDLAPDEIEMSVLTYQGEPITWDNA